MSTAAPVRRSGPHVWRPSLRVRALSLALGLLWATLLLWQISEGALSRWLEIENAVLAVVGAPMIVLMLFRQRMVLEPDELVLVFATERRLSLREIVAAKSVPADGLTFICADGAEEGYFALGNSAKAHRSAEPTRADLAARAVLCAAATARGDAPPLDYRLPPVVVERRSLTRTVVGGAVSGFLGGLFTR